MARLHSIKTISALLVLITPLAAQVRISSSDQLQPPARYGLAALEQAFGAKGLSVDRSSNGAADFFVTAGVGSSAQGCSELPKAPQALLIRKVTREGKAGVVLCGSDARGLMYAALDAAQRVAWSQSRSDPFQYVRDTKEAPVIGERGVSMYTMQRAYFESRLYDEHYWKRYFDMLARDRINSFVVIFGYENGGFMAPLYPYFFNVLEFPGVRLVGITPEQQNRNTTAFRRLIEIAHERGIEVVAGIWDHIYRGGVQGGGIPGASDAAGKEVPGLVVGVTGDNLASYTKAALRDFVRTFPELDAIQFRMHSESGLKPSEMEGFWHEVFGMIKQSLPNMHVDLRAKELPDSIIQDALAQGLKARVATKFWMEQMGLPYHPSHVNRQNQHDRRHGYADLLKYPQTYTVHWRLWNGGTTRLLLWGDPEYVRKFVKSAQLYNGDSLEVNEMLATKMLGEPHEAVPLPILTAQHRYYDYEFERYWHFYQVWGRLAYNPNTPSEVWERAFQHRFGPAGLDLMKAMHLASNILPRIVAAAYRYQMFPTTRGWAEMMRQDDLPKYAQLDGSDIEQFMNPKDAAKSILAGTDTAMLRPQETSRWFTQTASEVLKLVSAAEKSGVTKGNKEAVSTLADLKILAHLAEFHAARLPAAVDYNLYRQTGDLFAFDGAIRHEKEAAAAWRRIVESAGDIYSPELAFGVHRVGFSRHWKEELGKLDAGLEKLAAERQQAKPAPGASAPAIAHVPVRKLQPKSAMNIQASIASQAPIKQVNAFVADHGMEFRSTPMAEVEPGMYRAEVTAGAGPEARYYIEAVDASQNRATFPENGRSSPIVVKVTSDTNPPSVRLMPVQAALPGQDLPIAISAEDASGIKTVRLRYRHVTQYEDYAAAEMKTDGKSGRYTAVIPARFIAQKWDLMYFVEAIDNAGNGRIFPSLDNEAPYVIVPVKR